MDNQFAGNDQQKVEMLNLYFSSQTKFDYTYKYLLYLESSPYNLEFYTIIQSLVKMLRAYNSAFMHLKPLDLNFLFFNKTESYLVSIQVGWVIKQLFHACVWYSQTITIGAVGDLVHCCSQPSPSCNSTPDRPRHLGVIVLIITQPSMYGVIVYFLLCHESVTFCPGNMF